MRETQSTRETKIMIEKYRSKGTKTVLVMHSLKGILSEKWSRLQSLPPGVYPKVQLNEK